MNELKQQDIVWVKFPYSDLHGQKFRPAVVVSNNAYNRKKQDVVVCAITSNLNEKEHGIMIDESNLSSGKLLMKSMVRADKIMLIEKALVAKTFARLNDDTFDMLTAEITKLMRRSK
ncbi:MAG: type II toxin-antitoxin system PemK/MazF family toxin [Candidatus Aenigmatarchaeota archaeon]